MCVLIFQTGTYPLARPTTSFFSSQCWPCLYSPLSSTALLSPLVKNLMSPFSLWTKYQRDFRPQCTPNPLFQYMCVWMRIRDKCEAGLFEHFKITFQCYEWHSQVWYTGMGLSDTEYNLDMDNNNNKMQIHTFHGSLVLCVLWGFLCLLS